jgi:hypothetical protein
MRQPDNPIFFDVGLSRLRQEAISKRLAGTLALHFLRFRLYFGGRLSSAAVLDAAVGLSLHKASLNTV